MAAAVRAWRSAVCSMRPYDDVTIQGGNGFNTVGQVLAWTAKFNGGGAFIDLDFPYEPASAAAVPPRADRQPLDWGRGSDALGPWDTLRLLDGSGMVGSGVGAPGLAVGVGAGSSGAGFGLRRGVVPGVETARVSATACGSAAGT